MPNHVLGVGGGLAQAPGLWSGAWVLHPYPAGRRQLRVGRPFDYRLLPAVVLRVCYSMILTV